MTDSLRISLVQAPIAWENRDENLARYGRLLRSLGGETDLAVLPETFTTAFSMNVEALADTPDGITVSTLKDWAETYRMAITGSIIVKEADGRCYNRAFFVAPGGQTDYYDKRHLFSMAGEDRHFSPGNRQTIVRYRGWKIRLLICYDLRFPVWSRNVDNDSDLLVYMANWPESRIRAWQTLLPARAVENQAYVCAVNRTGCDPEGVEYRGRSAVYCPKGEKLADAGDRQEALITCVLEKEKLDRLRARFPAWKDADAFVLRYRADNT